MRFIIILFAVCFLQIVYAQGEYLERGNNAYGIVLAASYNKLAYGLAASASGSIDGTFDIGLSYAFIFAFQTNNNLDQISRVISPFLKAHFVKQSKIFPVSFSAFVQYQKHMFISNFSNQSTSLDYWTYGGALFHLFDVSENYSIQPFILYSYTRPVNKESVPIINGFPTTEFSVSIISRVGKKKYIVHPSVAFGNDETIYSLSFEFVNIFSKTR